MAESEIDFHQLWLYVAEQFPLGEHSVHGPSHWRRVEQNGLKLAADWSSLAEDALRRRPDG